VIEVKKASWLGILIIVFILFFSACAYIDIRPMIDAGFTYLNSGDLGTAETCFREALRRNYSQPQANLGLSLIALFRGNAQLSSYLSRLLPTGVTPSISGFLSEKEARKAQAQKKLLSLILKARANRASRDSIDLSLMREQIQEGQSEIAEIVALLEEGKMCLERAMTSAEPVSILPNHFDWNQNGILEPDTPLQFSRLGDGTPVWRIVGEVLRAYREVTPEESTARFFNPGTGDAWFDKELIDLILSGEAAELDLSTWEPVFDDFDILTIGQEEMRWLYLLVTAELSILEPFVIYQLDFGNALQDFLNTVVEIIDEEGMEEALAFVVHFLDTDHDGKISALEWRSLFDEGFLSFRPEEQNGGAHAIESWKSAIVGFCETMVWMIENRELPFIDALGNSGRFSLGTSREDIPISERLVAILQEVIAYVTDPTKALELFAIGGQSHMRLRLGEALERRGIDSRFIEELRVLIYPGVFFAQPEVFCDLKEFFPELYYQWVDPTFPMPELILFEDPTFGGFLQADINGHPWNGIFYRIYLLMQRR